MNARRVQQAGVTLVVSLIMLIVLTLLVVSAIRFGNINLKVAANAQTDAEGQAAAQIAIDSMLTTAESPTQDISQMVSSSESISTGGASYAVTVTQPGCITTRYIMTTELNPVTNPGDKACFGGGGADQILNAAGTGVVAQPTECKSQTWEAQATMSDPGSGAGLTLVQGMSARVGQEVSC